MPRWESGSDERLKQAALDLFDEQGFENTTAVQIAERARVTTRTFFRYFPDKEATLFADADQLRATLVQGVIDAPDVTQPLRAVLRVLTAFDWLGLGPRDIQRRRDAMIASHPDLLERELMKQHEMADAFSRALQEHGIESITADLATRVAIQVFATAYKQWLAADRDSDLAATVEAVMSRLTTLVLDSSLTAR